MPLACKDIYLNRYASPGKGWTDRDESRWPVLSRPGRPQRVPASLRPERSHPRLPAPVAEVVRRYAPVAEVMNDFYCSLYDGKPTTSYPAEQIDRTLIASGLRS